MVETKKFAVEEEANHLGESFRRHGKHDERHRCLYTQHDCSDRARADHRAAWPLHDTVGKMHEKALMNLTASISCMVLFMGLGYFIGLLYGGNIMRRSRSEGDKVGTENLLQQLATRLDEVLNPGLRIGAKKQ